MRNVALVVVILGALALLTGCAKYEYALVRPPELARHIGRNVDQVVTVDPLEYRLRTVDNRLVIRVFNPTDDPIELVGPKCSVVDPGGESHPLRSQSIAPGSFIKLILPPMRPRIHDPYYGPTWNMGVGVGYRVHARPRAWHGPPPHSSSHEPRYLVLYDDGDVYYWDWKGESDVRTILAYRRGDKEFRHEFLFRRKKM